MFVYRMGRLLAAALVEISIFEGILIGFLYTTVSYVGLAWAGEAHIVGDIPDFIYWLVVTASTVGYGDLSPQTPAGKLFATLFVIPIGLMLFAMLVTRIGYFLTHIISRRHRGLSMIHEKNHCIIIGWTSGRTNRLIELLTSRSNGLQEKVVLCSATETENPLPDDVEFIKVESFSKEEEMKRCGIENAKRILIDLSSDDMTLTTALLCRKLNPEAHKTVYFQDENIGKLLKSHCPNVEVIPSLSIELLARATLDPGSSTVHQQLLDSTFGVNQFSSLYEGESTTYDMLFSKFKKELNATLIGFRNEDGGVIQLNPALNSSVNSGASLFYYANGRIENLPGLLK